MEKKERIIEGFYFEDAKTAEQAKREADGIQYIRENTDMDNAEVVLQLYRKLMEEKLFETPVGMNFLKELRDYLLQVPTIQEQDLAPIHFQMPEVAAEMRSMRREKTAFKGRMERKIEEGKKRLRISLLINLFLAIVVVGMLVITMTSNRPNIVNYENKIVDKYAQWQQELEEREQAVREKEKELQMNP